MAKKQNKTRKVKKGLMTIPQLRKAFDHIENYTTSLLKSTKDATERRKAFQKEWKKVFHRDVDDKSANAYIEFEEKKVGKSKGTRKQKGGQRGGAAILTGAPLDYSTRPGIDGIYGTFPAYVSSGLVFYNDINKEAPLAGCGTENTTPKVPISIGSNEVQKGGRRTRKNKRQGGGSQVATGQRGGAFPSISEFAQAMSFRPVPATAPPSMIYTAQMDFKGTPSPPSSQPNTATPPYIPYKPTTVAGIATEITRDLGSEIRS
jgi:hypothetical protein